MSRFLQKSSFALLTCLLSGVLLIGCDDSSSGGGAPAAEAEPANPFVGTYMTHNVSDVSGGFGFPCPAVCAENLTVEILESEGSLRVEGFIAGCDDTEPDMIVAENVVVEGDTLRFSYYRPVLDGDLTVQVTLNFRSTDDDPEYEVFSGLTESDYDSSDAICGFEGFWGGVRDTDEGVGHLTGIWTLVDTRVSGDCNAGQQQGPVLVVQDGDAVTIFDYDGADLEGTWNGTNLTLDGVALVDEDVVIIGLGYSGLLEETFENQLSGELDVEAGFASESGEFDPVCEGVFRFDMWQLVGPLGENQIRR